MFDVRRTSISGCYEICPRVFEDARGRFVKVFHQDAFAALGFETNFAEEYYSVSHQGVIRGMHFQTPPMDHVKVVYCTQGAVFDVVVDLRRGSPTYGQAATFSLSAEDGNFVYIPKGMAHGFCAINENTTLVYKVSTIYAPEHDAGILYSSVNVEWPAHAPIMSNRDLQFPSLSEFESPFIYE